MFRHFTGLTMLRERPLNIYAGQEDVFGPGYFFFSRQNPVFLFPHNTLLIFLQDNTKRTIAFDLSWIFFSEKKNDIAAWIFFYFYFFSEKLPTLPIKKPNDRFLNSDSSAAYLLHSVIACLE